jgi:hypothetical protein
MSREQQGGENLSKVMKLVCVFWWLTSFSEQLESGAVPAMRFDRGDLQNNREFGTIVKLASLFLMEVNICSSVFDNL